MTRVDQCPDGNCRNDLPGNHCIASLTTPINAEWSEIYLNRNLLNACGNNYVQRTIAHESGHAMMLSHNWVDLGALMYTSVPCSFNSASSPNGNDIGSFTDCRDGGFGMRCLYGLW